MPSIVLKDVSKRYGSGPEAVAAVSHVTLELSGPRSVAIVGPSGSGKSTLLAMMGLVLRPDEGTVEVNGVDGWSLGDARRCALRNATFGYVFQDFALLEDETVYENVRLPLLYGARVSRSEQRRRIEDAVERLGIQDKLGTVASKLSGGQKQRVAIARAMVREQQIVLADEPTGSLDAANRRNVTNLLLGLSRERGNLLVVVTHNLSVAGLCDEVLRLEDGRVTRRTAIPTA